MNFLAIASLEDRAKAGELRMLNPLLAWLAGKRWIREDSIVVQELPLHGRRVDVSTLTRSGTLSAFELKLGGFGRVLEQASYNRLTFDRSWVVVGAAPRAVNLQAAIRYGIGVIVVDDRGDVKIWARPGPADNDQHSRRRVASRMAKLGVSNV